MRRQRITASMSHGRQPQLTHECGRTEPAASRWLNALVGWTVHFMSILKATSANNPAAMSVHQTRVERGTRMSRRWIGPRSTCSGNQPMSDGVHHHFHLSERVGVPADNSPESNIALSCSRVNGPDSTPSFLLMVNCAAILIANDPAQAGRAKDVRL